MARKPTIDAETFRQCLRILGLSYAQAAEVLRVHSRQRVADFARGRRPVPPYLAAHIAVLTDRALARKGI